MNLDNRIAELLAICTSDCLNFLIENKTTNAITASRMNLSTEILKN